MKKKYVDQTHDPASGFYAKDGPFMKKDHLKHGEILAYQDLSAADVMKLFADLGTSKGAQLFWLMLQSYKIVTRVANAGWEFVKMLDVGQSKGIAEAVAGLRRALHDYSPENFAPNVGELEYAANCFEQFYDEATKTKTREEMEELVFTWTDKLHNAAKERKAKATTSEDILVEHSAGRGGP